MNRILEAIMDKPVNIRLDKITIKHITEDFYGASIYCNYLTKEEYMAQGETEEDAEKYALQDADRLYRYEGGYWWYIGIKCTAQVSYDIGQGNRRLETLTSGGLWGIESDSEQEYIQEVEREQLQDLKEHLQIFGVNLDNWDNAVFDAERKSY